MTNYSSFADEWAASFTSLLDTRDPGAAASLNGAIELLSPQEMNEADRLTINAGTAGILLMERAGRIVAEAARRMVPAGARIAVMVGPGNNGGDGIVAGRLLAADGYAVSLAMLGQREWLKGDAAIAARSWSGEVDRLDANFANGAALIIDALFGAGLDRPIEGTAALAIDVANQSGIPILAVDLPSGIDGRSGQMLGSAILARETVTFFRMKPGHLLLPGRQCAGAVTVADIGISPSALESIRPQTFHNLPGLWLPALPRPRLDGHKYDRGHAVSVSGPVARTGAARLAARGALRIGAGLVTIATPPIAVPVIAGHVSAIMILPMEGAPGLADILSDRRRNAVVLGPALGVGEDTVDLVEVALLSDAAVVVDADGLTSFADRPEQLFGLTRRQAPAVFTPHDGEFARLFPDLARYASKLDRAAAAAERAEAVIVLKGADTVVAAPDGRMAIADNAPPDLATAGSGDVLAGMVCGLLAQRMPAFEAAAAAVWLHGAAGRAKGRGLVSEDIPEMLPAVFTKLGLSSD